MITLGVDTSNYTTSCALYDSETGRISQRKKLLPVKPGEKGIRQSDAVFHHTAQLHLLLRDLFESEGAKPDAVGASSRPRDVEGSYMPCFTVGEGAADGIASALGVPFFTFSHQAGHVMAALYSCGKTELVKESFIAFHFSGGTTEALYVTPDKDKIFNCEIIGKTLDINCGQVIDRAGVMLGLDFPCGRELESLAKKSGKTFNPKVCVKDGSCCLSGAENLCSDMLSGGSPKEDVARFAIDYVGKTIEKMALSASELYPGVPMIFAGGVSSDTIIRERIESKFGASFAQPEFSCDNAAGTALLAYERGKTDGG